MPRELTTSIHTGQLRNEALDLEPHVSIRFPVSLSVVIPAYNEAPNLVLVTEEAVRFLRQWVESFELLIVDDGSADETLKVVRQLAARLPEVREVRHTTNLGYGASLRDGFSASQHEWIFFTDADHQFRIDSLLDLLPLRDQADLIVGFRRDRQDPWIRRVLSFRYNVLMRLLFGVQVKDIDCAFKLFHRKVLESFQIESQRFFVNTELLVKARANGFRILESGVEHFPREYDRSKVSVREIPRTLREVLRIWRLIHRKSSERV